jgi:hypothetical protein
MEYVHGRLSVLPGVFGEDFNTYQIYAIAQL